MTSATSQANINQPWAEFDNPENFGGPLLYSAAGAPYSAPSAFTAGQQVLGADGQIYTIQTNPDGSYNLTNSQNVVPNSQWANGFGANGQLNPLDIVNANSGVVQNWLGGAYNGNAGLQYQPYQDFNNPTFGQTGTQATELERLEYPGFVVNPGGPNGVLEAPSAEELGQLTGFAGTFGDITKVAVPLVMETLASVFGGPAGGAAFGALIGGGESGNLTGALEGGLGGALSGYLAGGTDFGGVGYTGSPVYTGAGTGIGAATAGPGLSDIENWLGNETGISLGNTGSTIATKTATGLASGAISSGGNPLSTLLSGAEGGAGAGVSAGANSAGSYLSDLFGNNNGNPSSTDITATNLLQQNAEGEAQFGPNGQPLYTTQISDLGNSISYNGTYAPTSGQGVGTTSFGDLIDQLTAANGGTLDLSNPTVQQNITNFLDSDTGNVGTPITGASTDTSTGTQTPDNNNLLQQLASKGLSTAAQSGISSLIGGSVAGAAANSVGAIVASQGQSAAANQASQLQLGLYNQAAQNQQPFIQAGQTAAQTLATELGVDTSNPLSSPLLQAPTFTQQELQNTPGYSFSLQQGLESVQNQEASEGLATSGAAIKEAANFATQLASSTYQQQYTDAITNQTNQFQRLLQQAQTGEGAASQLGQYAQETGASIGSNTIGASNALAAAISSIAGNVGSTAQLYPLYNLLQNAGGGGSSGSGMYGS